MAVSLCAFAITFPGLGLPSIALPSFNFLIPLPVPLTLGLPCPADLF